MENPAKEIAGIIQTLCTAPPTGQREALEKYFVHDAAFYHPFCRVDHFDNSRDYILSIYRWYKILAPRIEIEIESVAFDPAAKLLYATATQAFKFRGLPLPTARARLTTVLHLTYDEWEDRYLIRSQNDLYQTDQFIAFVLPAVGPWLVWLAQLVATLFCVVGAAMGQPLVSVDEWRARQALRKGWKGVSRAMGRVERRVEAKVAEVKEAKKAPPSPESKPPKQSPESKQVKQSPAPKPAQKPEEPKLEKKSGEKKEETRIPKPLQKTTEKVAEVAPANVDQEDLVRSLPDGLETLDGNL